MESHFSGVLMRLKIFIILTLLITLSCKDKEKYYDNLLGGKVIGENGKPLVGVEVKLVEKERGAFTDANGEFKFGVDDRKVKVLMQKEGYGNIHMNATSIPAAQVRGLISRNTFKMQKTESFQFSVPQDPGDLPTDVELPDGSSLQIPPGALIAKGGNTINRKAEAKINNNRLLTTPVVNHVYLDCIDYLLQEGIGAQTADSIVYCNAKYGMAITLDICHLYYTSQGEDQIVADAHCQPTGPDHYAPIDFCIGKEMFENSVTYASAADTCATHCNQ